ncbi:MAG: DUF1343 domain-containing protein [Cytophagales bacterium]|nr:DUF1343 domain-containing protein [Cytophagales bacterium]MDW8385348.1 DUF1343 domain-containing protein [Flammeovirgaceae bacterium]
MRAFLWVAFILLVCIDYKKESTSANFWRITQSKLLVGAEQPEKYLDLLRNKHVALVVNHTARVGEKHLVDFLKEQGINISKIFVPEHGFRGTADAGEKVDSSVDSQTNIPLISLYGKEKKPSAHSLQNVDILVFDIQDVGVRFYTYISTLHYVMEACAEHQKPLIVLDRPNPNGHYIDGPILEKKFSSFVGIHPIPVVHGLTIGELALMINGEKWLEGGREVALRVVPVRHYTHLTPYSLPVKPSPNLVNDVAIALYPSLCFFEGTDISVGRGTPFPFQVVGAPEYRGIYTFAFVPQPSEGSKNPLHNGKICYGIDLRNTSLPIYKLDLTILIDFYQKAPHRENFFNSFFDKLAGTDKLRKQIQEGMTAEAIRQTWQQELILYKQMRKKYLLYQDFE